jgi:murein DD-endopeptidase MepM/ murein hydrolase activator NlpD
MVTPPTATGRVTSPFGWRQLAGKWDLHTGTDFAGREGDPAFAVLTGFVRGTYQAGILANYGNTIVLEHAPALFSLYGHLQTIEVEPGAPIIAGEQIGRIGCTAGTREDPGRRCRNPHLHFEFLDRWPPPGIDLNRLDPSKVIEALQTGERPPLPPALPPPRAPARYNPGLLFFVALYFLTLKKKTPRA